MAANVYLASTLLTGLFLVAIVFIVLRTREWNHYTPTAFRSTVPDSVTGSLDRAIRSPVVWTISFLVFTFALVLAGLAFVGSPIAEVGDPETYGLIMAAIAGMLLVAYFFAGVYYAARSNGYSAAAATGVAAWMVALLLVVAVSLNLLLGI